MKTKEIIKRARGFAKPTPPASAISGMLAYPKVDEGKLKELAAAKKTLLSK